MHVPFRVLLPRLLVTVGLLAVLGLLMPTSPARASACQMYANAQTVSYWQASAGPASYANGELTIPFVLKNTDTQMHYVSLQQQTALVPAGGVRLLPGIPSQPASLAPGYTLCRPLSWAIAKPAPGTYASLLFYASYPIAGSAVINWLYQF